MRVGFFFWPYTPEYTARMARLGEELGFDLVGIADTPGNALDPWVAMTIAAAATTRVLRLATCVTNLVTRHPAITASAAASVDATAEGRTILGIGAGHSGVTNVGGARSSAADLREGIALLKTALSGAPAAWRGAATHLAWVNRPVPVYAAASGPAALRAVGAAADGALVNYGLGAGIGFNVPAGAHVFWPDGWQGRDRIIKVDRRIYAFYASAGLELVKQVRIGGGLVVYRGVEDLTQGVNPGVGTARLSAAGNKASFDASLELTPFEGVPLAIGLDYKHQAVMDLTGTAHFDVPPTLQGTLQDQNVSHVLPYANQFHVGVAEDLDEYVVHGIAGGLKGRWFAVLGALLVVAVALALMTPILKPYQKNRLLVDTKVDGDALSFRVDGETALYTGTLAGDEIKMKVTFRSNENGTRTWSFVARRARQ